MRVGPLAVDPPTILAPMAEMSDLALRTVCEEQGAGLTITEFLSAEAIVRGAAQTLRKLTPSLAGRPFGVQIFGRDEESLALAARQAAAMGASLVDINMGCPAKRVVGGSCGVALMREPELAQRLVRAVRRALPPEIPVSVKHRAGWDEARVNAVEFAQALVEAGAAMITVHGRTRAQGFSGRSSLAVIRRVREALPAAVPVVGNGDVLTLADFLRMREETGCDAVMIGRGALGNPWIFRAIAARLRGEPDAGPPTPAERLAVLERHLELCQAHAAPARLRLELPKILAWYSKGMHGCAALREQARRAGSPALARELARAFFAQPPRSASRAEIADERMQRLREMHRRAQGQA